MIQFERRNGVPQMTLEHFERDFGDRHLLHGIVAEVARLRAAGGWDRDDAKA